MKKIIKRVILVILIIFVFLTVSLSVLAYKIDKNDVRKKFKESGIQNMMSHTVYYSNCTVEPIRKGMLNGYHIKPNNKTKNGVVVTFGGAEGGCGYDRAIILGQQGYEVFALFYFGQDNQPEEDIDIPLEFFEEFLDYTKDNNISLEPLSLIGSSLGAQLSLLLSNYYAEIDNVVLYAPASYLVGSAELFGYHNSFFKYEGKSLDDIKLPFMKALLWRIGMRSAREVVDEAIKISKDKEQARIKTDNIKGEILIFAGDDDVMIPSDISAREIYESNPEKVHLNIYENAGHNFEQTLSSIKRFNDMGGTAEGNAYALEDSNKKLNEFLEKWHGIK